MSLPDFPLYFPRDLVIADPKKKECHFRQASSLHGRIKLGGVLGGGDAYVQQKPERMEPAEKALMISTEVLPLMGNLNPNRYLIFIS